MADPSDLLIDRTLVLLRHAKAVPSGTTPDADRPLADRGRADAAAAGRWLLDQGLAIDLVLCSSAKRARETWQCVAAAGVAAADVWYDKRVYDASAEELLAVLHEVPAGAGVVVLVGHAPGVPDLADDLASAGTDPSRAELRHKYPTTGLAVLGHTTGWSDLGSDDAELDTYVVPRA